ncbi:guanine nucleotide exchange factor MSS4 homolog [Anopheles ziemanni]|uniref:guanine nucleotide exchange factor MSS4 homolog n=1 Tax=Anopheles coustani TaxID=139045 RepID=UPI002659A056|nr:guanine nucleotide exchange factor MSS4 homolog [Anopheles coustani]XP_058173228.1 guanine nucleotide exchange factor MSS4 homolog [Anopheles ziemanni]
MASEQSTSPDYTHLVDADSKNKTDVKCDHCGSVMLKPANAEFTTVQYELPLARQKRQNADKEEDFTRETLKHFWMVKDMFTFENIGFSNTVNNRKYLICADCEIGPVGYHDLETKQCYVALGRVKHE